MPYSSISSVPKQLITAGLSLKQANDWARYYDEAKGQGVSSPAAIAWKRFKSKYYKAGNNWKIKKTYKGEEEMKQDLPKDFKGYSLFYRYSPQPLKLEDVDAEGKIYEKELIREGEWAHPQRPHIRLKITLKRMQEWVSNFNKKLFKVPIPKRHSLDPEDNRGWVKDIFIRKGDNGENALFGHLDITNNKMQKLIDNGDVQDVSVSVGNYTDNQGNKHGETLQHVALTVIPHIDGQSGFAPINAEGYMCFEETGYIKEFEDKIKNGDIIEDKSLDFQALDGSKEKDKEDIGMAIKEARLFPEPDNFSIIGTYDTEVIVNYFGGGEGVTGQPISDRYFKIPYTKDLSGNYVFGDKKELIKKYYFIQAFPELEKKEFEQLEELLICGEIGFDAVAQRQDVSPATKKRAVEKYGNVNYADEKNKKYPLDTLDHVRAASRYIGMPKNRSKYSASDLKTIDNKIESAMRKFKIGKYATEKTEEEVNEMKEFEALQEKNSQLEKEKVDLEAKVVDLETKVSDLEAKVVDLEKVNSEKDNELKKIEDEKKAAFEKEVDDKISSLLSKGHIVPASKEKVKKVLMQGGVAAEMLEEALKNQKAISLESETEQDSIKPEDGEMTDGKAETEADRISKL